MKNYLSRVDGKLLTVIRKIGKEADRQGVAAYIVGGIVRDIILKKKNLDLDIVVEGDAIRLAKVLARAWNANVTVYDKFGTATVRIPKGIHIDFAMARKERYMHLGALPTVLLGRLNEDLFRRDFTINAMAIAIHSDRFGQLIDEFGGHNDLLKKVIRVLHAESFEDDPTRILRAVRFEQRFSFHMERQTLALMKEGLKKKVFLNVKPPRYFAEFKKILCEADPLKCLKRLHQLEGLCFLDPELKVRIRDMNLLHQRIKKARKRSLYVREEWWLMYMMGLIARADDRIAHDILSKFPFTKKERLSIQQSRKADDMVKRISAKNLPSSQVYRTLKPLTREAILYIRIKTLNPVVSRRIDRFLTRDSQIELCINGQDLKRIGITSGSKMGRIMEHVLCLKIDKKISTKTQELKAAQAYI